jgi:hypothetical protein
MELVSTINIASLRNMSVIAIPAQPFQPSHLIFRIPALAFHFASKKKTTTPAATAASSLPSASSAEIQGGAAIPLSGLSAASVLPSLVDLGADSVATILGVYPTTVRKQYDDEDDSDDSDTDSEDSRKEDEAKSKKSTQASTAKSTTATAAPTKVTPRPFSCSLVNAANIPVEFPEFLQQDSRDMYVYCVASGSTVTTPSIELNFTVLLPSWPHHTLCSVACKSEAVSSLIVDGISFYTFNTSRAEGGKTGPVLQRERRDGRRDGGGKEEGDRDGEVGCAMTRYTTRTLSIHGAVHSFQQKKNAESMLTSCILVSLNLTNRKHTKTCGCGMPLGRW